MITNHDTADQDICVVWQEPLSESDLPEEALFMRTYTGSANITVVQRDNEINISTTTVPDLLKALKKLNQKLQAHGAEESKG